MAWSAPRTYVTGETITAAILNADHRDNLLETSAATATTAGDLVYADAANSMGSRLGIGAVPAILSTTGSAPVWRTVAQSLGDASYGSGPSSTSYTDFDEVTSWNGTNVTVTVTTGTRAMVWWGCRFASNTSAGAQMDISFRVSGATTTASGTATSVRGESSAANDQVPVGAGARLVTLTAGSNVFTLQALISTGTGTIGFPYIIVQSL
jgi:hypothetical protein